MFGDKIMKISKIMRIFNPKCSIQMQIFISWMKARAGQVFANGTWAVSAFLNCLVIDFLEFPF